MTIGFDEIKVEEEDAGKIVTLTFRGQISKEDYDLFVPQLEWQIEQGGKIRLLVELHDFRGWTVGALWEDTKFAARHFNDLERLAVVGEKKWEKGLAFFAKPFTTAAVRYFDMTEREKARAWIREREASR